MNRIKIIIAECLFELRDNGHIQQSDVKEILSDIDNRIKKPKIKEESGNISKKSKGQLAFSDIVGR